MSDVWRVFCAVEISDDVRAQLREHIQKVREAVPEVNASWTRVENVHLTLKFLGDVAVDQVPRISAATGRAATEFSSFQIGVGMTGVFPKPSRPQVLWIGVNDSSGKLSELQQRLENECAVEGFAKEGRAYRPHLTIARIRKPEGSRRLAYAHMEMEFKPAAIDLNELIVFRSESSSKGSKYTTISKHELRSEFNL